MPNYNQFIVIFMSQTYEVTTKPKNDNNKGQQL